MGKLTILGCGGSGGVPLATGYWGNCDPNNPKNKRLRASVAVHINDTCVVVDTGPDFRYQSMKYGIKKVDAVLYTHAHSDHVNGIDELRYVQFAQKSEGLIQAYGDAETFAELERRFGYLFRLSSCGLYKPVIDLHPFTDDQYGVIQDIAGVKILPFWQQHGAAGKSLGYRFGDLAYSTDCSGLDDAAFKALKGIETWIVDCGQFGSDFVVAHPNLDVVKGWNERVGAKRVILTHMTPRIDYAAMSADLPDGFEAAYDGLSIDITVKNEVSYRP